ncbi:MAG: hypothetical protein R6X16_10675 [Anaerolineae bacterium]
MRGWVRGSAIIGLGLLLLALGWTVRSIEAHRAPDALRAPGVVAQFESFDVGTSIEDGYSSRAHVETDPRFLALLPETRGTWTLASVSIIASGSGSGQPTLEHMAMRYANGLEARWYLRNLCAPPAESRPDLVKQLAFESASAERYCVFCFDKYEHLDVPYCTVVAQYGRYLALTTIKLGTAFGGIPSTDDARVILTRFNAGTAELLNAAELIGGLG